MRSSPAAAASAARVVSLAVLAASYLTPVQVAALEAPCGPRCTRVGIVTARLKTVTPRVILTGGIQAKFQSNVAFRVSGKITKRLVEIGEHVEADQVLAAVDPQEQKASLDTARAALASAQALLTQAQIAFQRQETLFKSGYTTRPSYDGAQQQLRTQAAAVESGKALVGTAEEQLGYADLKPGVAGIVTARSGEVGQVVQAGQTVFTLAQDGPRDAVFDVYESLLAAPPASRVVDVALQSDPSVRTTGTVREISPSVDAATGTVKVKVGLEAVPPRMSLGAAVIGSGDFKPLAAIVLPRAALFRWNGGPAVWLLDRRTGAVTPKPVGVARYDGETIVLSGGVEPGEAVVAAGTQFLHPGQIVEAAVQETQP